ncbi:MAG: LysM peptidoglycan-binding domain-containing protein [Oscillospiraceae bacterium]|nr:LysM peptidoglycan-binding domain-containing protein [Oscillospiraceae bacterium]
MILHTIKSGDTIYKLSKKYNVSEKKIIEDNNIKNINNLLIGQSLVIIPENIIYKIKKGDTLYKISKNYNITLNNLLSANPNITNPDIIYIDQDIKIPANSTKKLRSIDVTGYAFPGTTSEVLSNILPSLTYLNIFSYQIQENGSLDSIFPDRLINLALAQDVAPIMTITNTRTGEGFDSDLAHLVLTDPEAEQNLIDSIIFILNSKKYQGVNLDLEYIFPEDKENYNIFLKKLTSILRPLGYITTTALAPKISDSQTGILYEAHDYKSQAQIVDQIILMTYEWGYLYGPPQPVSPIDQVEKVLKYAVSVIPSQKIVMGMPNYGYDWTLPYIEGSAATSLTNLQAIELASKFGASIEFDEKTQTPFFEYTDNNNKNHIVWFDDARSIESKLKLIDKYNLLGVSYWNINTYFPQNWLVLNSLYNINKIK